MKARARMITSTTISWRKKRYYCSKKRTKRRLKRSKGRRKENRVKGLREIWISSCLK
jgi:hypothetical protein